ncbi:hypothetical protein HDU92_007690 [Lobulomyces angularis]|nr:hypothetical protein HDU92_007690 [Lobulomyces angularis]
MQNAELSVIFIIMAIFCFGILFDKLDPLHSSIKSITPLRKFIAQDEVTFSLVRKTWLSTTKTQQITSFSNLFILMFSNFIYGTPLKFSSVVKFLSEQFGQYFIVFVNGTILLVLFSKLFKKNESDSKLFYITHLISYALTGDLIPFTILNAFNLTFELFLTNFKLVVTISILVFKNELKRKSLHSKILIENRADTLPELLEEQGNTDNIASKKDDLVLMFFKFFFKSFIVCLKYYWSLLLIYYLVQVYNDLRKLVNHVGFKYPIGIKSYSDAV